MFLGFAQGGDAPFYRWHVDSSALTALNQIKTAPKSAMLT